MANTLSSVDIIKQLADLAEITPVGFFDWYPKKDMIFWDESMHHITGLDPQSDINRNEHFFSQVHPDDAENALGSFQALLSPESDDTTFVNTFRIIVDNKIKYTQTKGLIFRDADGEVERTLGIIRDLTEQQKIQAKRLESEERLRNILENTADNIFAVDQDSKIIFINRVAPGLTTEQVIGTPVAEFVTPSDKEKVENIVKKVLSEGTTESFDTVYDGPAGMKIYYSSKVSPIVRDGEIIAATFISRDVSSEEITRQKLSESEFMFRMLFESSTDNIFTIDKDWKINLINAVAPGLKKEEVIGTNILDFVSENQKQMVNDKLKTVFKEKIPTEYGTRFEAGDQTIFYSTRISPLIENDEVYGAVLISREITELVKQEEILKEQTKELTRTNQNLEQLAYVSSHDMKAPVANLQSLVQILENEGSIVDEGKPVFEKLKLAVDQMNRTIKTLNEVFNVQSNLNLDKEVASVKGAYDSVMNSIENLVTDANATINTQFDCPNFNFPEVHLNSIIQNLLTNSIKYRHPDRDPEIYLKSFEESGFCWLEVNDNGKGIDLEKYGDKIFGLFQRFDLNTEGKGIGLHLVKTIVENYGGEVLIKSQPGEGSTFILRMD